MTDEKISDAGRKARFEQWEALGLDAVKQDLATGGYRLIGGSSQVRALAREWVRMKEEAEETRQREATAQEIRRVLGESVQVSDIRTDLDRLVKTVLARTDDSSSDGKPTENQALNRTSPSEVTPSEIFMCKPNIYGIGIDLKEALRRLRKRIRRWRKK